MAAATTSTAAAATAGPWPDPHLLLLATRAPAAGILARELSGLAGVSVADVRRVHDIGLMEGDAEYCPVTVWMDETGERGPDAHATLVRPAPPRLVGITAPLLIVGGRIRPDEDPFGASVLVALLVEILGAARRHNAERGEAIRRIVIATAFLPPADTHPVDAALAIREALTRHASA